MLIDKDLSTDKINELLKKSDSKVIYYSKNYCDLEGLEKKYKSYYIDDIDVLKKIK